MGWKKKMSGTPWDHLTDAPVSFGAAFVSIQKISSFILVLRTVRVSSDQSGPFGAMCCCKDSLKINRSK